MFSANERSKLLVISFSDAPPPKLSGFQLVGGLRTEQLVLSQNEDIVKLVLDPPSGFEAAQQQWQTSLLMALTIDEIWKSRNNAL